MSKNDFSHLTCHNKVICDTRPAVKVFSLATLIMIDNIVKQDGRYEDDYYVVC
jgi:hypothetical protein